MTRLKAIKKDIAQYTGIGIDVSKADLTVCALGMDIAHPVSLHNEVSDIRALCEALQGYGGKIILESTGYYHWLCAVMLTESGYDVRLINPLLASKHHRSAIRGSKTDPQDAYQLASMALTERDLPSPWEGSREWVQYRHKVGILCALDKVLQQMKASLDSHRQALALMGCEDDSMVAQWQEQLHQLRRLYVAQKAALGAELSALSEGDGERIAAISGVSGYTAGVMGLLLRKDVKSDRAWIAYAGLDIRVKQSGQWQGRSRLSKRGNAYLRKLLYQAAWGLKQHDASFRAYYQHLRDQGRCYVEAMLMIARKFLRICFALVTQQQNYNPQWFSA